MANSQPVISSRTAGRNTGRRGTTVAFIINLEISNRSGRRALIARRPLCSVIRKTTSPPLRPRPGLDLEPLEASTHPSKPSRGPDPVVHSSLDTWGHRHHQCSHSMLHPQPPNLGLPATQDPSPR